MNQGPLSPDGKYRWDGQKWNPVEELASPQPQRPRGPVSRSKWVTIGVVAGLVVCFPIGLILTWLMPWSRRTKLGITAITSALLVVALIGVAASSSPRTTTQSAVVVPTPAVSLATTASPTPSVATATPTLRPTPTPAAAPPAQAPQPTTHADYLAELRAEGVSAICHDGTLSYSRTRSGTCSHHGGVREWTGLI